MKNSNKDIVFHFNPRLRQNYAVRNSRLGGRWGEEETISLTNFPFVRGEEFVIVVFVTRKQFMVAVNGHHFCSYAVKLPLSAITGIEVCGNVDIYGVEYKFWRTYPENQQGSALVNCIVSDTPTNLGSVSFSTH